MVDVARRAGVSRALVSIVFRGKPGASPANRAKVLAAAAELGYTPDVNARRLRAGTSRLVGVVFDGHDPFTARVLDAAHEATLATGLDLVLTMTSPSLPLSRALATLEDQRTRANLLISSSRPDDEAVRLLTRTPSAFVGAYAPVGLESVVSCVHSDDDAGIRAAVDHLAELGHRRLAVMRVVGRRSGDVRADAGLARAAELGLEAVEVTALGYDESSGVAAGHQVLDLDPHPTAVVAANDSLALGVIHVLREAGLRVPQEVSVTGFDDAGSGPFPAVAALGLTTLRQDAEEIVTRALLQVRSVADGSATHRETVLAPTLVVRSSTTAPPR